MATLHQSNAEAVDMEGVCFILVANVALRAPVAVLQRFGTELMNLVIKVVPICKK
jgi:hypothetical protein